jgi:hypothetical protein
LTGNAVVSAGVTDARGVVGTADGGSSNNHGVYGSVGTAVGTNIDAGVLGDGTPSNCTGVNVNVGVMGRLNNTGATINSAIYGDDNGLSNGINSWAGFFTGDVNIIGSCYQNYVWQFSDKRLKKNIEHLTEIRSKIQKLGGYRYSYRVEEFRERRFDEKSHLGLLAQEVKEVFPELVREDAKGFYAVDYQGMIPVLLEAIKDLQNQVDKLSDVAAGKGGFEKNAENELKNSVLSNSLKENNVIQNIPNPFTHETTINYSVPDDTKVAYLAIYDLSGKELTTFSIIDYGESSITINAEKLVAGIYLYCIVADGKISESKRMIVAGK